MNKKLSNELYEKYPIIFQEASLTPFQSCMGRGICVRNGWYNIIDNLCRQLNDIRSDIGIEIIFKQVKEKFGRLTIYVDYKNPIDESGLDPSYTLSDEKFELYKEICDHLVYYACDQSMNICEVCGEVGILRTKIPWIQVLCDKHFKQYVDNKYAAIENEE